MKSFNKKNFTTQLQFTDKQQKAAETMSLAKKKVTIEEIVAREKVRR